MSSVVWIALNTYREVIRNRVLYGLVFFAVLLFGLSLAVGQMSYSEQGRITVNFGLAGMQLSAVILAIFVGSTLVSRELEKKTVHTLLPRRVTRTEFLLGKYVGLMGVIASILFGLGLILTVLFVLVGWEVKLAFVISLIGVFYEAMIMLALTVFWGVFLSPFLTVSAAISLFLIGHWVATLSGFLEKQEYSAVVGFWKALLIALPDLERFNWREAVVYGDQVQIGSFLLSTAYCLVWTTFLLSAAALVFRKRDLS
jgi:Cu-processing system permease protein